MSPDTQALLRRLSALGEAPQRVRVLAEQVASHPASQVVAWLAESLHAIQDGSTEARLLIDVFHAVLDSQLIDYDQRADLYAEARKNDLMAVQRLILPPPPSAVDELGRKPANSLAASGAPLGRRTWLARRADRETIDKLLHDPEPSVVANLLKNPFLIEADVIRIAARRPTRPAVLAELSRSPRWSGRYRVRRALVFNPYTAVDLALRQVPFLNRSDLLAVARDAKLEITIREAAMELARHRPPETRDRALREIEPPPNERIAAVEPQEDGDGES